MVKQNWMEVRDVKAMAWTNSVHDTPMLCNEGRGGLGVFFLAKVGPETIIQPSSHARHFFKNLKLLKNTCNINIK